MTTDPGIQNANALPPILLLKHSRRIDEHALAVALTQREGGSKQLDITEASAAVKHVLDILGRVWAVDPAAVVETIARGER